MGFNSLYQRGPATRRVASPTARPHWTTEPACATSANHGRSAHMVRASNRKLRTMNSTMSSATTPAQRAKGGDASVRTSGALLIGGRTKSPLPWPWEDDPGRRWALATSPQRTADADTRRGGNHLRRRRLAMIKRPPERRAVALVARPGSISGPRFAKAAAEKAVNTNANPHALQIRSPPLETQLRVLIRIVKISSGVELGPGGGGTDVAPKNSAKWAVNLESKRSSPHLTEEECSEPCRSGSSSWAEIQRDRVGKKKPFGIGQSPASLPPAP